MYEVNAWLNEVNAWLLLCIRLMHGYALRFATFGSKLEHYTPNYFLFPDCVNITKWMSSNNSDSDLFISTGWKPRLINPSPVKVNSFFFLYGCRCIVFGLGVTSRLLLTDINQTI